MLRIDKEECVGCGICANICPQGIEMVGRKARIKDENADCLKDAADACPRKAIIIEGEEKESGGKARTGFTQGTGQRIGMRRGQGMGAGAGRVGGERGRMGGFAAGSSGNCVCPICGYKRPHQRGVPCYQQKCPKCSNRMTRG